MALRVLLADESSTIRKVMQLSLQDFGVEVKSVPLGVDVVSVAQGFKPDLIFVDILLQKKNGYEVCADIKQDAKLAGIPVILMWSGFMDLDEAKAKAAKADGRLEKPFDNQTLRSLVEKYVTKTRENPLKGLLTFPDLPEFVETPPPVDAIEKREETFTPPASVLSAPATPPPMMTQPPADDLLEVDSGFDQFKQVQLNKAGGSLESYKLNLSELEQANLDEDLNLDGGEIRDTDFMVVPPGSQLGSAPSQPMGSRPMNLNADQIPMEDIVNRAVAQIDHKMLEGAVHKQARDVLEVIAWKILPDMVEKVVREELNKLLRELDGNVTKNP